jgi:hypothetical protein
MAITWISWGAAPGYINTAPKGLKGSCLNYKSFSKSPFQAKVSKAKLLPENLFPS